MRLFIVVKIVAIRYYFSMDQAPDDSARAIAELVVQLGRATHDYVDGLSPAQWNVLRYLARANRHSRTVSAFAAFHATTRGTASQTVKSLVAQGYVEKTRSAEDGRSAILDLTDAGRAVLARDPCTTLVNAAAALPAGIRAQTVRGLRRLLSGLEKREDVRPFGACAHCAFLEFPAASATMAEAEARSGPVCSLKHEVMGDAELGQICVNFKSVGSAGR
jgi:DNA-binding MarR family transcriptional regulator